MGLNQGDSSPNWAAGRKKLLLGSFFYYGWQTGRSFRRKRNANRKAFVIFLEFTNRNNQKVYSSCNERFPVRQQSAGRECYRIPGRGLEMQEIFAQWAIMIIKMIDKNSNQGIVLYIK